MEPVGAAGLITPWNANALLISVKLATAIAAGCTAVIKPSEMSAIQTQIVTECFHDAGLPAGAFNIVNGRGDVAGAGIEQTSRRRQNLVHRVDGYRQGDFVCRCGNHEAGYARAGGKSPTLILDDADLAEAVPIAVSAGFMNSGQACGAGTRILVPADRLAEVATVAKEAVARTKVGNPREPDTQIGPMVSQNQWERSVQRYIRLGIEEGAAVLVGGQGHPSGLEDGYFVKPTIFTNVSNDTMIAREFGPVLSFITYRTEEEAIAIANDTPYGLQAYVFSKNAQRGRAVASQIAAGSVLINGLHSSLSRRLVASSSPASAGNWAASGSTRILSRKQ